MRGDFSLDLSTSNFGAWQAENVALTLNIPSQVDSSSLEWEQKSGIETSCEFASGYQQLNCSIGTMSGATSSVISISGNLNNPTNQVRFTSSVTTTTPQHPDLIDEDQESGSLKIGGCGCTGCDSSQASNVDPTFPAIMLLAMGGLYQRRRR